MCYIIAQLVNLAMSLNLQGVLHTQMCLVDTQNYILPKHQWRGGDASDFRGNMLVKLKLYPTGAASLLTFV